MNTATAIHGLSVVILTTVFSASLAADQTEGYREAESNKEERNQFDGYAKAKWADRALLYKTTNGHWRRADKFVVKKTQGAFLNQAGQRVPYQPGDVIFKTGSFGWYKSDPGEKPAMTVNVGLQVPGARSYSPRSSDV